MKAIDRVSQANQTFYDQIAEVYDRVDSRRDTVFKPAKWLTKVLTDLRQTIPDQQAHFLDAGAGTGYLAKHAAPHFEPLTLVDISARMLERLALPNANLIHADCSAIPLNDGSVDVIGGFATLHHLLDPVSFFREAMRLLKPGGWLFTDHDIESHFVRRFKWPLRLYRHFFDHGHAYLKQCPEASEEDYRTSEIHGESGLDARDLVTQLKTLGFHQISFTCHWQGMGAPGAMIRGLGLDAFLNGIGRAPVVRLLARKP